jgi:DNA-nicking Smr family endonuclease
MQGPMPVAERAQRRPAADDVSLWRRAMRDVAPLSERRHPPPPSVAEFPLAPPRVRAPTAQDAGIPARAPRELPPLDRLAGVDRATAERLKRGRMTIEGRLDLHGMTQEEAHRALGGFVAGARHAGRRCVLVITGRGLAGGGVLRHAVPRWLDEPDMRRHLLAIAPAQPRDGGNGALYLLIRRPREVALAR